MENLTLKEATDFFAKFYNGEHHIPGFKPKQYGFGWSVVHDRGGLATFDFYELTKLVVMAHDMCIRADVSPKNSTSLIISIHKRQREGGMSERHPELNEAVDGVRVFLNKK